MPPSLRFPWQSHRLQLRKFQADDRQLYLELVTNATVMKYIAGVADTTEQADRRFAEMMKINSTHPEYGFYFTENQQNNDYLGLGKLEPKENGEIELGYSFLPAYWGKGYGSEISQFLVRQARLIDDSKTLMAIINPENTPSKRILIKSGFTFSEKGEYKGLPSEIYRLHFTTHNLP